MKKCICLLLLIIFNLSCSKTSVKAETREELEIVSPLSIKGMELRDYSDSELKIVRELESNSKSNIYEITYTVNGSLQYGLMSIPKEIMPKNGYPVIIQIHGYVPYERYSTINSYRRMFNYYSESEFIVIKPDLRGHGRSEFGVNFDSNLSRLLYAEDVLSLTGALKSYDKADLNNIFLTGHSNGGDTILRLITAKPELFRAASLWAPVAVELGLSNFYFNSGGRHAYGIEATSNPKAVDNIQLEMEKLDLSLKKVNIGSRSSISFLDNLDRIRTPFVIRHSDGDKVCPYSWSLDFEKKYIESNNRTEFNLINYPDDDHNLSKHYFKALKSDLELFRKYYEKVRD